MYEYITGRIETLTPASVVVEAAGVGYFLNISLQTFSQIGSRTEVKLYAHFAVREDAQVLYGFFSRAERDIFRSLIGVSGVGGNTARMILSSFTAEEVCKALSITKRALQYYRSAGIIPYTALGNKVLFRDDDIRQLLEKNLIKSL